MSRLSAEQAANRHNASLVFLCLTSRLFVFQASFPRDKALKRDRNIIKKE